MSASDEAYFAALREDDAEKLYETAPCGYLSTDGVGVIVKANQTFLALTGYRSAELVGVRRFAELLTMGGRIYHETHYAPMLHMGGSAREIALDLVRPDGTVVPVLVNAVADRDPDGSVSLIRIAVFDATYRREYERELVLAKERAESSERRARSLAQTLQRTLIPPVPPAIRGLDVGTAYHPAGDGSEVGGDFFDVFPVDGGDWVVTVGDVCGKGAAAAVVTAFARYTLRAAAIEEPSPAGALARLNAALRRFGSDRSCTVVLVRLHRAEDGWRTVLSCAGHPPALLRTRDGQLRSEGRTGTLLGVVDEPRLHDVTVDLGPEDQLLLYTDGLPDGRRGDEFYDEDRIRTIVAEQHPDADAVVTALLTDVLRFQDGDARDDIAIVALRASETRPDA
jgi:phosphoserine phosphatase RsbU/P